MALVVIASCAAADPQAPEIDARARGLIEEVAKSYKALPAYSDQGEFILAVTINGKKQQQGLPLNLTFVRPNRLNLHTGQVNVVSDGKTLTTAVAPLKKFTKVPAPEKLTLGTFQDGPIGSVLFGGPTGPPMFILLNLLMGDDPVKEILGLGGALRMVDDRVVAGTRCRALVVDLAEGPDFRLLVDPSTKLLKGIDLLVNPQELIENVPGQNVSVDKFGWTPKIVKTGEPKADAFAYEPPQGFSKVEAFPTGSKDTDAVKQLVGKPAPDFTLTVFDGPGKTKNLSKADLAGKVVLINFWATWCEPCLIELPEVHKMIESYTKDKKDVVIVALSQDSRPNDPARIRSLIEKTLGELKIVLTGTPVGLVGMDPEGTVGEAFQVNGLPTSVILDAKGIVQAAYAGYNSSLPRAIAKDLDTLLAGKSLLPNKPEEAVKETNGSKPKEEVEKK